MALMMPGQRLPLAGASECHIRFAGVAPDRVGIAAISRSGAVVPFQQQEQGWHCPDLTRLGDGVEIVAYMTDDRYGGFVNQSYPLEVTIGGDQHSFPEPDQQLAAVILAEVYLRDGKRRLKVSNEGFTFGIDAYARARNMAGVEMPFRVRPRQDDHRSPAPGRREPDSRGRSQQGQMLGTGSGVVIGRDLVITNAHVIEDGQTFSIGRSGDRLVPLAVDPLHDLALLQGSVSGAALPLRIGSPLWLGEPVLAAGYPLMDVLGSDLKVTTGNISGLTGSAGDASRFQFTAPIGSGSSGGAILDEAGNVVGIIAAALSHRSLHERGSISENVNFGVKAALVFELLAAAGAPLPETRPLTDNNRREVVQRLRSSVISISVSA